jgi:hypothetical protein
MKKFLPLAFLLSVTLVSNAQWQNSNNNEDWGNSSSINNDRWNNNSAITVQALGRNNYQVMIDNNLIPIQQTNNGILVNNMGISAGNHNIIVYENRSIIWGGNTQKIVYNNNVNFANNTEVLLTIQNDGTVFITSRQMQNGGWNNGNNFPSNKRKKNKRNRCDNGNGRWNDDRDWNGGGWSNNRNLINETDFNNLKAAVNKESFDDRKLQLAKQATSGYYFTTEQVKALVNSLSFDNNKLDLAKHMYTRTNDGRNYYQVAESLSFGSNRDELLAYIRR